MTPPGTFERVYAAIKQRLREGVYRPGDRLEPAVLSDELNASVTPVRDALHRLTGERLVEAPRHGGFNVPMLTETVLRQLYAWHLDLLLLAVMKRRAVSNSPQQSGPQGGASELPAHIRLNALFLDLAASTGNPEHAAALRGLTERLEPVQRIEDFMLDQTGDETAEIVRSLQAGDHRALRQSLVQYHRRREKIAPELLARLLQT